VESELPGRVPRLSGEWERRHTAFHQALTAACGSSRLTQLRAQLFNQTNRYRRLVVAFSKVRRDDRREHRALMEAALARDAERAVALIHQHIRRTADLVRAIYGAKGAETLARVAGRPRARAAVARRQAA
jgi:DNA-binding GntR family transcriptional regulator